MTPERISELREILTRVQSVISARYLAEALDALEASQAELKRIAGDKAYLHQANVANEWEERYQSQERRLEMKTEESEDWRVKAGHFEMERDALLAAANALLAALDNLRAAKEPKP